MEHQREEEVMEKLMKFVENFVALFEMFLYEHISRLDVDLTGIGLLKSSRSIKATFTKIHKLKKSEKVKEVLVESGIEIFANFENQFVGMLVDGCWERTMVKLAEVAVARIIHYFEENEEIISVEMITKAVILDKQKTFINIYSIIPRFIPGHTLRNDENVGMNISELFEKPGIVAHNKYYQQSNYGYRLPFAWEIDYGEEVKEEDYPKDKYEYIIKQDKNSREELKTKLLDKINKQETKLLENKQLNKLTAKKNVYQLVKWEKEKKESRLFIKIPYYMMEKTICISALDGVASSETAVKYAYNTRKYYDCIVIINAKTQNNLQKYFHSFAKDYLGLSLKNSEGEIIIQSILHDVYEELSKEKCLYIFLTFINLESKQKLPLALQQPAKFIKHNNNVYKNRSSTFKVRDYITKYKETSEKLLDPKIDLDEQTKTVYKTLILMVNTIKSKNVKSLQILNIISYFAPNNIPEKIFLKELANNDHSKLHTITSLLEMYSIVRLSKGMISVHHLVQQLIRLELDKHEEEKRITLETALRLVKEHMEDRDSAESFTPHIISIWNDAIKYDELIKEYIVNDNMEKYTTYFHLIAGSSSYEVVESVVRKIEENYPDELDKVINAENKEKGVPLHNAALIGDEPIIKLLLEKGAKVNARKNHGWTPLLLAAKNGHTNATKTLLNDPRVEVDAKTNHSNTALHFAANSNNSEIVQLLINANADVNAVTKDKYTPLHLAAKNGNVEIVKILLSAYADAKNTKTKANFTPLHFAARNGHLDVVNILRDENMDVNAATKDQFTPLHFAAMKGHLKVVNALLNKNANVKVKTTIGKTPRDLAKKQEIIHQLELKEIN